MWLTIWLWYLNIKHSNWKDLAGGGGVQLLNCVWLFATPWTAARHQLPELAQTHVHWSVMPSNHLILCCPPFSSCPQSSPASGSFPMSLRIRRVRPLQKATSDPRTWSLVRWCSSRGAEAWVTLMPQVPLPDSAGFRASFCVMSSAIRWTAGSFPS